MYDEASVRELLIQSCHSSEEAHQFFALHRADAALLSVLIEIAVDAGDHGGDGPMQAAYFASQFSAELLAPYAAVLLRLLPRADGYGGHVAVALAKCRSPEGRAAIIAELGDGSRFDAWLFMQALSELPDHGHN
jgi:hypothetical protein